jgi:hypothetical protein
MDKTGFLVAQQTQKEKLRQELKQHMLGVTSLVKYFDGKTEERLMFAVAELMQAYRLICMDDQSPKMKA